MLYLTVRLLVPGFQVPIDSHLKCAIRSGDSNLSMIVPTGFPVVRKDKFNIVSAVTI